MKKYILIALSFVGCIIIAASCTKGNDVPANSMTARIGNDTFRAQQVTVSRASGYTLIDGNNNKAHIVLNIYDFGNANGVFLFDGSDNRNYAYYTNGMVTYTAKTGQLSLVGSGNKVTTGSFSFMSADSTKISSGTLSLNL